MKEMDLAEFSVELGSLALRPGLLFGPDISRAPGNLASEFHGILKRIGLEALLGPDASDADYPRAIDAAYELRPDKQEVLRHEFVEKLRALRANLETPHLVKAGWSAYISLTEDLLLEEALRNHADGLPTSKAVTIVDSPLLEPPVRSYPVYKLLGNLNNSAEDCFVCLSDSELTIRRQSWSGIIRTLTNYLRDAPLLVVGFTHNVQRLREVLGLLAAQGSPRVTKLRFLKQDPVLNDATVKALLKKFDVAVVDARLRELCEMVSQTRRPAAQSAYLAPEKTAFRLVQEAASRYDSPVTVVPHLNTNPIQFSKLELQGVVDSLFRPASSDWRPYQAQLDLRRDCTEDVVSAIGYQLTTAKAGSPRVLMLVGEAGVGKTTLTKRVALEVSNEKTLVLWCRRVSSANWLRSFREWLNELFTALKKDHENHFTRLVVVCDDPWGLRIDATDALVALEKSPIPALLVATLRNSDRYVVELRSTIATSLDYKEIDIPFELSSKELERLASMLFRIGAVKSVAHGNELVATVNSKNAKDILCSLWYLVPETKSQLAESLKDEYFRLGEVSAISELVQTSQVSGKVAHKAYEYVTVSSRLNIGLPVEILVHALGIDYADWIGSLQNGKPLWGLLYDDMSDDGTTVVYFTRNEVVTRVLIDLVNGGLAGRMGEVRVLKELIQNCKGAGPYRNYLIDVLVRARHKMSDLYSYEQGCELYEAALASLSSEDRLFEHHYGIWIQDKGPKDGTAYRQLEKALQSSTPSGSDRDAPREHIHASLAASTLQQIRHGSLDWSKGSELVKQHLRLASSATFFNSHTSHVAANLLFETAQLAAQSQDRETADKLTVAAFEEIERAYQTVGARTKTSFQYNKTIGMLGDLQRKILALIPDVERLKLVALALFAKNKHQSGFELAARRMLVEAIESGKGREFNAVNDYLNECMVVLEEAGATPTADLLAARVDLMVRWRLLAFREVDWESFRDDLLDVLSAPKFKDDVYKHFLLAVAYFHLGETSDANAAFAQLRRNNATNHRPNDVRAYFQDSQGNPRRFQGNARQVSGRPQVSIPELQVDVPLRVGHSATSGLVHVYIGFSFNGLVAVGDKPESDVLALHH